ncbi:MAG: MarC family protein, partial [Pseudolabrys sp.]
MVLFVTYILLLFSDAILRVIGRQGASVLVRVMGLILCSLAVEIVLTAPIKQRRIKPNLSARPLPVYLMTGKFMGLSGNRILLMSRSKT